MNSSRARSDDLPRALLSPHVRIVGVVDYPLVRDFLRQMDDLPADVPEIAISVTTPGGDADLARRLAQGVNEARDRLGARMIFLGVSQVHSAGVNFMAAFPREDRYLTRDAILLIHGRRLERTIELSGPVRGTLAHLRSLTSQVELGIELEEEGFKELIQGSDVDFEEIVHHSRFNWYLRAEEALKRGLVSGLL